MATSVVSSSTPGTGGSGGTQNLEGGAHCGTTSDATFSDCQTLLTDAVWDTGK